MMMSRQVARMHIGLRIREAREGRGLGVRALAALLGVSAATVSAIENGHTSVTVDRLEAIATALNVQLDSLLREDARRPDPSSARADWRVFEPLDIDPVLAGAIATFVETGYHGATMRSIAEKARMSVAGVYHHYASKQALLVRALDLTMDELDERLADARADGDTAIRRLALQVEALALFHTLRSDLAFIGASEMRSIDPADRDRIAGRRSGLQHLLDDEIDAAVRDGSATSSMPREVGRAIATMCTSLPQWFDPAGHTTPQAVATQYAALAMKMVSAQLDDAAPTTTQGDLP